MPRRSGILPAARRISFIRGESAVFLGKAASIPLVALGNNTAASSADGGVTWSGRSIPASHDINDVAWSGSRYAAVGTNGTTGVCITSEDGETWVSRIIPATESSGYFAIVWTGTQFVASGRNGAFQSVSVVSPDGITWSAGGSLGVGNTAIVSLATDGSTIVGVGTSRAITSPDGVVWTTRAIEAGNFEGVAWSGAVFSAVANSNIQDTSPTGVTWTPHATPAFNNKHAVAWSSDLGLFAACGESGSLLNVITSPTGVTWTSQTVAAVASYVDIMWTGTSFVVLRGSRVETSPDGSTWTERALLPAPGAYRTIAAPRLLF